MGQRTTLKLGSLRYLLSRERNCAVNSKEFTAYLIKNGERIDITKDDTIVLSTKNYDKRKEQ